jgi:hypothetical protein
MIKKTNDYNLFKFRNDNREGGIIPAHVKMLETSILSKNMLQFRPIVVNAEMEIIDGQHRLIAARNLSLPIYYEMREELVAQDIIRLNISRQWSMNDYFNFHLKNHSAEYIKLEEFMKKNNITLRIALMIVMGNKYEEKISFKNGDFIFQEGQVAKEIELCWGTINFIKKQPGDNKWTSTSKFWNALLIVMKHPEFEVKKWMDNLEKHISRIGPRANFRDYMEMILTIYNWRNTHRIETSAVMP